MPKKKYTRPTRVTIAINAEHEKKLKDIALALNCRWGEKGNISELMRQISLGNIKVTRILEYEPKKKDEIKE